MNIEKLQGYVTDPVGVFIPSAEGDESAKNELKILGIEEEGGHTYSVIKMLRKYKNNPDVIQYIADMME